MLLILQKKMNWISHSKLNAHKIQLAEEIELLVIPIRQSHTAYIQVFLKGHTL